ncbi:hypothetical protein LXA43DRAFT_514687 [Ganoderma leucocontextum]|nr:hypothetical protein LXA43DRAFT_514687 [Ganoderma leucocontextum]
MVRQSVKLTERAWLHVQNILQDFLENTRRKRVQDRYKASSSCLEEAIIFHCIRLPRNATMDCRPCFIDLAMDDRIRVLIEHPVSTVASPATFSALIPSRVADWHVERRKELVEFFIRHLGPLPDGVDPLSLATAVIVCPLCQVFSERRLKILRYPDILAHDCTRFAVYPGPGLYASIAMTTWMSPFNLYRCPNLGALVPFSFARGLSEVPSKTYAIDFMLTIVSTLGLDPSRATREDVQRCDARLRCVVCEASGPGPHSPERQGFAAYTGEAAASFALLSLWSWRTCSCFVKATTPRRLGDKCLQT